MLPATEDILSQIEDDIRVNFPDAKLEFATQSFNQHVELWVYVLDLNQYENVQHYCRNLFDSQQLDKRNPEIWLLVKTWTGPLSGGASEQEIKQKREEFRNRHSLV